MTTPDPLFDLLTLEGDIPLDFDRWSTLSARLLARTPSERAALFTAERVDARDFDDCDRHWTLTLARDLQSGDTTRPALYGARCAAELRRRQAPSEPPPPPSPRPAPPPTPRPAPALTGTLDLSAAGALLPAATPLPFAPADPSAPKPPAPSPAAPPARRPSPRPFSGTIDVAAATPTATLTGSPPLMELLTIEQYASLTVDLESQPDRASEILASYRLTGDTMRADLDAAWRGKLGNNPLLRLQFQDLQRRYREWKKLHAG